MSLTIFRAEGLRFFFYSREEDRIHVHVRSNAGSAKIWIEPRIELAKLNGLTWKELGRALALAEEREYDIRAAWRKHFAG